MFDLKLIRENPELVKESLAHRKDTAPIDEIFSLDQQRRHFVSE